MRLGFYKTVVCPPNNRLSNIPNQIIKFPHIPRHEKARKEFGLDCRLPAFFAKKGNDGGTTTITWEKNGVTISKVENGIVILGPIFTLKFIKKRFDEKMQGFS